MTEPADKPRTEADVIRELPDEAQALLKRVLEIERSRLHIDGSDAVTVDELHDAIRGLVP